MPSVQMKMRDQAGFGLTEVAVAMVVLGIVLVGLFPLIINSIHLAAQNNQVAQANRIVVTSLDNARNDFYLKPCVAETNKPITVSGTQTNSFTAWRTVTCDLPKSLATVEVFVGLANTSDLAEPDADGETVSSVASAVTKVRTSEVALGE